ncbi:MAG: Lrp/AsnC family transcriptional regulator [Candidatus Hodarchaeota archaeon]
MKLDSTDYMILSTLLHDARKPASEIASETKKHLSTITRRIKTLENEKIIKEYTAILDYEKLGLELTVVTHLILSKGKLLETERQIATIPGVCAIYDVTGRFDAIVIGKFSSRDEFSAFIKKILAIPTVERTETMVVLNTIKEDFSMKEILEERIIS